MHRQLRNELRKKVEHYSYGLNDHLDLTKRTNIFRGTNETNEEKVAIKVVDIRQKDTDPIIKEHLPIEIQALKKLIHPNIVRALDVYSTVNNCYIITQFCQGGDLENRINGRGTLDETQALSLFRDLLLGYMQITHEKFIHGGLKLSSLLLKDNALKITGFSNCRKNTRTEIRRQVAYNAYQSPQSVRQNIFNHKSDIWSLGMILYVMLHGQSPFPGGKDELTEAKLRPIFLSTDLSEDVSSFIKETLVLKQDRLTLEQLFKHRLVAKLLNGYFIADKYALNILGQEMTERQKKQQAHSTKVEKHLTCQINWMRFLFRLMDRINAVTDEGFVMLKFIVLRQLIVQYESLKKHLENGQNVFGFNYWDEFLEDKQKILKYRQLLHRNSTRFEKAKLAYLKFMDKLTLKTNPPRGVSQLLNDTFIPSEYNSIFALGASLFQIKRLWQKIVRQYNPNGNYTEKSHFRYKNELMMVDFVTTYYQLNSLLIEDFHRVDYFEKMSKLDIILETQASQLDLRHLEEMESKLKQLAFI